MSSVYEHTINDLSGKPFDLAGLAGKVTLVVNVASYCGYTPQYPGLEALHERFAGQGFTVLGVPCNQFGEQEPGTSDEIAEFCSTTYGVTFPVTEKVEVNGPDRHPLYEDLTATPDAKGDAGDVRWNFEKFLVGADGKVIARFRTRTTPEEIAPAVEAALAS